MGKPASSRASVTAVYEEADGTEMQFSRVIYGSSSEYYINGRVVNGSEGVLETTEWRQLRNYYDAIMCTHK